MTPLAIALIVLVAMFLLGLPIFMSLIISSVVAILAGGDILPLSVIHNSLFDGLNLFPLLAIPCFVVAGTLMEFGNITQQIVDVVKQLVGRVYGGLGITTILACTFFAAISGSGPGTVAAVGTILVPAMVRNGYSRDYASAAASSGGTIGILIPPSNPMIIYAILGNLSVTAMFTAGFIPGFIVAFAMIMTAYLLAKRNGFKGDENAAPFNMKFFLRSCGNAGFALATPFIILGSIYTGWATPVEASVVAIVWALFVGIVINRVLRPRHIYRALLEGAMTCGAVLLIVMGGYLVSCVVGVVPSHGLAVFASLCPILSLFCAPVQWAAGNVPLAVLLASWALQLIVIAALMLLCARVYRELIVHRGSRVKLKQLLKMAKGGAQA